MSTKVKQNETEAKPSSTIAGIFLGTAKQISMEGSSETMPTGIHQIQPNEEPESFRYMVFDLEIAKEIPEGTKDWSALRPLGISCAATLCSGHLLPSKEGSLGRQDPD